jgi:hypothetical protein
VSGVNSLVAFESVSLLGVLLGVEDPLVGFLSFEGPGFAIVCLIVSCGVVLPVACTGDDRSIALDFGWGTVFHGDAFGVGLTFGACVIAVSGATWCCNRFRSFWDILVLGFEPEGRRIAFGFSESSEVRLELREEEV